MALDALLFDLDGTLLETEEGILACFRQTFEALGLPQKPDLELRRYIGPPLQAAWNELVGAERAEEAIALYRDCYETFGKLRARPYDGIPEALAQLSTTHRLFVATSKRHPFALEMVEHFGLARYFSGVYGLRPEKLDEDKTALIARVLHDQRLSPRQAVMIGDRKYDLIGAQANRVGTVGVLWGYGSQAELEAHHPMALCRRPHDLPGLIAKMPPRV
ncbi:HAD hydrolase-like protein [Meiothermus granaticius]|uniref:5'-nucleotidase n=1 Tax=Meiothermus granaticius NBRC 107808 TaxID=1227551 RepID=A0A399FBK6_9DEIN|nr:HAD hydrolase-like protein [Meiothermus granaticius]RIH92649.1 5'-nucleotidase [Meiothermus granaticius NBRC 107808]GEM87585.1 phosphoglycolate phosphatase [Meiothermus granaticius NBRC 107808]